MAEVSSKPISTRRASSLTFVIHVRDLGVRGPTDLSSGSKGPSCMNTGVWPFVADTSADDTNYRHRWRSTLSSTTSTAPIKGYRTKGRTLAEIF
jgi:hypothetical protein